ncbi:MAG: vWA domain-containing protein [Planctomycetota bacterium]|jgi:hypothetical protein
MGRTAKPLLLALLIPALFGTAILTPGALGQEPAREAEGVDVFFVVDNSGSMRRLDPKGLRVAFTHALTDLLLSRGGDRVSVIRLGGWLESEKWNPVVFPMTRIPLDPGGRQTVLQEVKDALAKEDEGFGKGSDFNAAFEKGISRQRSERLAVVIVVTDGNMEVIEGDKAPERYEEAAKELSEPTLRDGVNAAAMNELRTMILPVLARTVPGFQSYVIPVSVGEPEDEGRYVLKDLASVPGTRRIVPLDVSLLGALGMALRAPHDAEAAPWDFIPVKIFPDLAVQAGAESGLDLRIPLEATHSKILLLGPSEKFVVGLSLGGGLNLGEDDGVRVWGRFNRHRVIDVEPREIPDHRLILENQGEAEMNLQGALYCAFDLEGHIALPADQGEVRGGDTLRVEIGLKDRPRGRFVTDPWLLERLVAVVRLMDASGEAVEKRFRFENVSEARQVREILLDPRTPGGTFVLSAACRLVDPSGQTLLTTTPVETMTQVQPSLPTVQVAFDAQRAFLGHEVGLRGQVTSGYPPTSALTVRVDHTPVSGEEKGPAETELVWSREAKAYVGSLRCERGGLYSVEEAEGGDGKWRITRGLRGSLEVGRREITLLAENGSPLEGMTFLPVRGDGGGFKPITFLVAAELLPGESGVLTLSTRPHRSTGRASFVVSEGKSLDLTGENPRGKVTVRLEPAEGSTLEGEVGTLEIQGTLGGDAVRREAPVSATPIAAVEKPWTDLLERREVAIAGIVVLSLLLLGVLLLVTVPGYREQHVLHERGDGGWDEGSLLTEMRRGWNPRNSHGTQEVKNAIWFRLRGRKGLGHPQVWARPLKPFIQFFRNDQKQEGWTPLVHGDRLRLRGARWEHYYRFFTHALTPEEYAELQPESRPAEAVAAPAPEEGFAPPGELVIEIPTGAEVESGYEAAGYEEETYAEEAYAEEAYAEEAYAEEPYAPEYAEAEPGEEAEAEAEAEETFEAAAHGFQDEAPQEEAAPSPLAELETIFDSAPAAPAKEGAFPAPAEKSLSFTDIFGEEDGVPTAREEPADEEEEGEAGPEFEDQETIFEQFFGRDDEEEGGEAPEFVDEEEGAEGTDLIPETQMQPSESTDVIEETVVEPAEGTDIIQETVVEPAEGTDIIQETVVESGDGTDIIDDTLTGTGDGTEIVDEGVLAEAFQLDPEGVFSDGDITKLLEEEGLLDEDGSVVIDVPADMEGEFEEGGDVFSVGGEAESVPGGESSEEGGINPELVETQEVVMDRDEEEEGLFATDERVEGEEGDESGAQAGETIEAEMETEEEEDDEEAEAELSETVEDEEGISEIRTEIEEEDEED